MSDSDSNLNPVSDFRNTIILQNIALNYINYLKHKLKRQNYDEIKKFITNSQPGNYPISITRDIISNKKLEKKNRDALVSVVGKMVLFIFSEIKSRYYSKKVNMKEEFIDLLFIRDMFNRKRRFKFL